MFYPTLEVCQSLYRIVYLFFHHNYFWSHTHIVTYKVKNKNNNFYKLSFFCTRCQILIFYLQFWKKIQEHPGSISWSLNIKCYLIFLLSKMFMILSVERGVHYIQPYRCPLRQVSLYFINYLLSGWLNQHEVEWTIIIYIIHYNILCLLDIMKCRTVCDGNVAIISLTQMEKPIYKKK